MTAGAIAIGAAVRPDLAPAAHDVTIAIGVALCAIGIGLFGFAIWASRSDRRYVVVEMRCAFEPERAVHPDEIDGIADAAAHEPGRPEVWLVSAQPLSGPVIARAKTAGIRCLELAGQELVFRDG